jgi:hypothetical protein
MLTGLVGFEPTFHSLSWRAIQLHYNPLSVLIVLHDISQRPALSPASDQALYF